LESNLAAPLVAPSPVGAKKRLLFIDLYRSFVIFLMLEGHTFRTFLPPEVQRQQLFQLHEFVHGLTAPAFLFGAGLTFVISTRKRWVDYHHWDMPLAKRVRRMLLVYSLGLMLHLPYLSLRKIIVEGTSHDYLQLFQGDVLTTIGIGLLSLHAVIFFFKTEKRFYTLVLASIVSICFLTPLVWDVDFLKYLPPPIAQLLNGNHGSLFPLFPYVGFLYAGVIVSWEFLIAAEKERGRQFMLMMYALGAIVLLLGVVFDLLPIHVYPTYNFWFTSPSYFLIRLGALMVLIAVFWFIAGMIHNPPRWLTVLGIESLFVYVLHLVIIYGSVLNPFFNLRVIFGATLTVFQSTVIFVVLVLAMLGAALFWNFLKRQHHRAYRLVQLAAAIIFFSLFFTLTY
jgi:hypothetical protein